MRGQASCCNLIRRRRGRDCQRRKRILCRATRAPVLRGRHECRILSDPCGCSPILLARARIRPSLPAVSIIARSMALLLAAVWLPLTMHCHLARLEICGGLSNCCEDHSCSDGGCDCASDICKVIEAGLYSSERRPLMLPVAAIEFLDPASPVDFRSLPPPLPAIPAATSAPPGCSNAWQFVFRAALAPRAPSVDC